MDSTGHLRDSNVVFQEAITKLGEMKNPTERNAASLKLFGRSALELNPLIETSAGEIAKLSDEAHKSGAVISNEGVASMAKFNKSMDAMKLSISGAVGIAAAKLIPTFEKLLPVIQDKLVPAIAGIAQKIADLIQGFTNCSPFVQKLILGFLAFAICIGPVLAFVGGLIVNIGIIAGAFGALSTAVGAAGGMFAVLLGPIGITIGVVIALATAAFFVIKNWSSISAFFKNLWKDITTGVSNFITGVKNFFAGIGPAIMTTWDNLRAGLITGVTNIKTGIINKFNEVKTSIITVWDNIKNSVLSAIQGLITGLQTKFGMQIEYFRMIGSNIMSAIVGVWNLIKTIVLGIVLLFCDLITGNFKQLNTDFNSIMTRLYAIATSIWNSVKDAVLLVIGLVKDTIMQSFNNIKDFLAGVWSNIKTTAVNTWDGIKSFFTTTIEGIKNIATSVFNGISSFLAGALNGIKNTFVSVWNGVVSFFTGLPGKFSSLASGIGNAIKGGFTAAISFITGLPGEALKWGADIINGIVSGIKGAVGSIGTAVSGVAQNIRSFLHFSVPDKGPLKDFESWMPDFMGGLAKGIQNSKHLVTNAIKNLSTNMSVGVKYNALPSMTGANNSATASPTTIIFNGTYSFNDKNDINHFMNQAALLIQRRQ
jgi:phage-related protein